MIKQADKITGIGANMGRPRRIPIPPLLALRVGDLVH